MCLARQQSLLKTPSRDNLVALIEWLDLGLRISHHEIADRLTGILALEQCVVDLSSDGHIDATSVCDLTHRTSREDALRDFPPHLFDNLVQSLPLRDLNTDMTVATERADTGRDEVAEPREPRESLPIGPKSFTEANNLG